MITETTRDKLLTVELISAPNRLLSASSLLDGPKLIYCGNWPVARLLGGYFRIVLIFLFVCLPVLPVFGQSLR